MDIDLIEELAEQVHDEVDGSEACSELDRVAVRTVLNALKARGYHVVLDTNTL